MDTCGVQYKKREPLVLPGIEMEIHQHLFGQLKKLGCVPIVINGMPDHIHMLFGADYKKSLMEIMRDVKGETSYWCNKNQLMPYKLQWQDGFSGLSVSEDHLDRVKHYILNQKTHHNKKSYEEEQIEMISKFGIVQFD